MSTEEIENDDDLSIVFVDENAEDGSDSMESGSPSNTSFNWKNVGAQAAANIVAGIGIAVATAGGRWGLQKIKEFRVNRKVKQAKRVDEKIADRQRDDRPDR